MVNTGITLYQVDWQGKRRGNFAEARQSRVERH
jgi:hypothetical protein